MSDPHAGVRLLSGTRGFHFPPAEVFRSSSPSVAGSRRRGHRVADREVFWHLGVYAGGGQGWLDYDSAFWRTLQYGKTGTWIVTQPNGTRRSLQLTMLDDGFPSVETDPALLGWAHYGITLEANQPFWSGTPVEASWGNDSTEEDYFGGNSGGGFGPDYYISEGSSVDFATIENPGDVESWPVWTVQGPTTNVSVGVGGRTVQIPFELTDGESLVVDTHPAAQTAVDNTGTERTAELGAARFAAIPAGGTVPLSLSMVGTGRVALELPAHYYRAW